MSMAVRNVRLLFAPATLPLSGDAALGRLVSGRIV